MSQIIEETGILDIGEDSLRTIFEYASMDSKWALALTCKGFLDLFKRTVKAPECKINGVTYLAKKYSDFFTYPFFHVNNLQKLGGEYVIESGRVVSWNCPEPINFINVTRENFSVVARRVNVEKKTVIVKNVYEFPGDIISLTATRALEFNMRGMFYRPGNNASELHDKLKMKLNGTEKFGRLAIARDSKVMIHTRALEKNRVGCIYFGGKFYMKFPLNMPFTDLTGLKYRDLPELYVSRSYTTDLEHPILTGELVNPAINKLNVALEPADLPGFFDKFYKIKGVMCTINIVVLISGGMYRGPPKIKALNRKDKIWAENVNIWVFPNMGDDSQKFLDSFAEDMEGWFTRPINKIL